MSLVLPKPNQKIPATIINPRSILFYAEPKLGKTSLLTTLPDSLLIDGEDGSDAADTNAKINIMKEAEELGYLENNHPHLGYLKYLNEVGGQILKEKRPYKYVIYDTLSELQEWCLTDGTFQLKSSIIGKNFKGDSCLELPKGGGYYWWRKSYGMYYHALMNLPSVCFIGIAHIKDSVLVNKEGKEVDATDLSLTGQLKQITCAKADAIGYLYRKTVGAKDGKPLEEIWVSFRSAGVNAGTRFKRLHGNDYFLSKVTESPDEEIVGKWDEIFIEGE